MIILETSTHIFSIRPCSDGSTGDEVLIDSKVIGKIISKTDFKVGTRAVFTFAVGSNPDTDWGMIITPIITEIK